LPTNGASIRRLSPHDPAALRLLRASDEYMAALYPPESNHLEPPEALAQSHVEFIGAFIDGVLVGCGAIKRMQDDGDYGEIKRVFVDPALRGRGLARQLMDHLEAHALESGITTLRLETGISQPEAITLYERRGYRLRPPFGAYRVDPLSIFMEKQLRKEET
jgi:putative acetyltransferase